MKSVDIAIIGAGTAGLSARREVAKITDNYVVIDDGELGTTCARVGCMPSKVLIQIANSYHGRLGFSKLGISGAQHVSVDIAEALSHTRNLRDYFVGFVKEGIASWSESHLVRRSARFIDENTLDLGDQKLKAKKIIIATGSSPVWPSPWKKFSNFLWDTDQFFEQDDLPNRIAVIGLGVIGIELGQALARLGVQVTGVSLDKAIGGLSDPMLQMYAAETICQEFKTIFASAELNGPTDDGFLVTAGEQQFEVDKVLLSLGRSPNLKKLNLENLNIPLNEHGVPAFDKGTLRIKGTDIYIAGDVTGERNLLHEAADEGRMAGYNAVRDEDFCFRRRMLLAVTFSSPEIAFIGQTWRELRNTEIEFVTGSVSYEDQGRATIMQKNKGLVHIYAERTSGKILGAEMIAPGAEHFAHLLSWIVSLELSVNDVLALPFYHPVLEEGLRTALRDAATKLDSTPNDLEFLRCFDPPVGCGHSLT